MCSSGGITLPKPVIFAMETGDTVTHKTLASVNASDEEISELVQWTDVIVFDYIACQVDRYVLTIQYNNSTDAMQCHVFVLFIHYISDVYICI